MGKAIANLLLPLCLFTTESQIRVDVELTQVTAIVTDSKDKPVLGLTAGDFVILENEVPQSIAHFDFNQDEPISFGILIDRSGSMCYSLSKALKIAETFVGSLRSEDEAVIMTFAATDTTVEPFTDDKKYLVRALRKIDTVTGGSDVFASIGRALAEVKRGHHKKRALIVFSDGQDTGSAKPDRLLPIIKNSEIPVYGIGIVGKPRPEDYTPFENEARMNVSLDPPDAGSASGQRPVPALTTKPWGERLGLDELEIYPGLLTIATETGARVLTVPNAMSGSELDRKTKSTADQITNEIRGQYILGYYSHAPQGARQSIRVVSRRADVTVHARRQAMLNRIQ